MAKMRYVKIRFVSPQEIIAERQFAPAISANDASADPGFLGKNLAPTDHLITIEGLDAGVPMSANQTYFMYLSTAAALPFPNQLRASTVSPQLKDGNHYLNIGGNGLNWRFAGFVQTTAANDFSAGTMDWYFIYIPTTATVQEDSRYARVNWMSTTQLRAQRYYNIQKMENDMDVDPGGLGQSITPNDTLIDSNGANTGLGMLPNTTYFLYASSALAAYAPHQLKASVKPPDLDNGDSVLLYYGNGRNWRFTGVATTDASGLFTAAGTLWRLCAT